MKHRRPWLAWSLWVISIGGLLAPLVYRVIHGPYQGFGTIGSGVAPTIAVMIFVPAFATAGAVLASKRPSNPIGWLLAAAALGYAGGTFTLLIQVFSPRWADWSGNWVWAMAIGTTPFVLLLFPTGSLLSSRWRPVAWVTGVALASKSSLPVTVESDGIARYPQDVEAAVYFSTLEALQNVAKYARATRCLIHLMAEDGGLSFSVEDDWVGFDPETTPKGSGLTNMADRLSVLGGHIEVRSRGREGTVITGRLPVRALEPVG